MSKTEYRFIWIGFTILFLSFIIVFFESKEIKTTNEINELAAEVETTNKEHDERIIDIETQISYLDENFDDMVLSVLELQGYEEQIETYLTIAVLNITIEHYRSLEQLTDEEYDMLVFMIYYRNELRNALE